MRKSLAALAMGLGLATAAQATYVGDLIQSGATVNPVIVAGAPPDSPAARVDPNVLTSPFTGVVSINIRFIDEATGEQQSFICTGTAITPWHVLTAGHCVDPLDNGVVIDITQPGNDVRVVLNDNDPFNAATDLITAEQVTLHPDYEGFAVCPDGSSGCVNDDLAILRLPTALPSTVQIYQIWEEEVDPGAVFTMVGYGLSGDGINGYTVDPNFFIKRDGANVYDLFDTNDEQNFAADAPREVWYYDFDGTKNGFNRDTICLLFGVCSAQLGNSVETHLGGGDSGGPSFILTGDGYRLVANNTFGINLNSLYGDPANQVGDFGDLGGGVLLYSYLDWIRATAVPEPNSLVLFALGLLALTTLGRRREKSRS